MSNNYILHDDGSMIVIGSEEICDRETCILAFDLDHTLIKPKSGNKFSNSTDDWIWLGEMEALFKRAFNSGPVVIFTNQGGIEKGKVKGEDFVKKMISIFGPYLAMCQPGNNYRLYIIAGVSTRWRKPLPTMWEFFTENIAPNAVPHQCIFVGDAAGRDEDFSDSDCKFASNCGMKFYTPGEFVKFASGGGAGAGDRLQTNAWPTSLHDKLGVKVLPMTLTPAPPIVRDVLGERHGSTPDIIIAGRSPADGAACAKQEDALSGLFAEPAIVVIYVGSPASGKSTLTRKFTEHGFEIINQDTIAADRNGRPKPGTKMQCKKRLAQLLCDTKNHPGDANHLHKIVIDATHPDVESRKEYIDVVKSYVVQGYKVACVWMNLTTERCKWLNLIRCYTGGKYIPEIAFGVYKKKFRRPDVVEGFSAVVTISEVLWDINLLPAHMIDWKL